MAIEETVFQKLTPQHEKEHREYAKKINPPNIANWMVYHPVCREEWIKRGIKPPENPDDTITAGLRSVVEIMENLESE